MAATRRFGALLLATAVIAAPASAETLDQAIAAAMAHAPQLAAARAREDAAKARLDGARTERMPQASVEAQIGAGRIDPQGFFGLTADDVVPRSARATVELPLFTGGRTSAGIDRAAGGAAAAMAQTRSTLLALRVAVVRAYTGVRAGRLLVARYARLLAALDEAVRHARLKFQAGEGASTDVAQAEARRAEALAGKAAAEGQLATAQSQLAALTGGTMVVDDSAPLQPDVPTSEDAAVARALSDNPDLAAARSSADASHAAARAARADRLPIVGAYAEAATVNDQFFPGYHTNSASVGLRAQWRFFDGGRTGARVRAADADRRAADADADAARLAVEQQAVAGYADLRAARAVLAASEARVTAAEDALRATRLEVKAGAKPALALLDAEREAIEASADQIDAQGRLLVAAYRLRAIAGME